MKSILINHSCLYVGLLYCLMLLLISCTSSSPQLTKEDIPLEKKIGQMIKVGFRGLELDKDDKILNDIKEGKVGGVVLFDYDVVLKSEKRNIASLDQVMSLIESLQTQAEIPLLVAIDQEGGRVNRLKQKYGFPPTVSAQYLGSLHSPDSTAKYAESTAKTLHELGINVNLAPVVDLNTNPENPVIGKIERSYSADPEIVTAHAMEFIKQHHQEGVLTTLKHFPGHGSSQNDSHLGLVDITDTWSKSELQPYKEIIDKGMADIIMTAHVFNKDLDPEYPATLSLKIITGILRDSLNYQGVVMSDDMNMKAISEHYGLEKAIKLAIDAGVDILSFGNNLDYDADIAKKATGIIQKLVQQGEISEERIDASYQRIMKLKDRIEK